MRASESPGPHRLGLGRHLSNGTSSPTRPRAPCHREHTRVSAGVAWRGVVCVVGGSTAGNRPRLTQWRARRTDSGSFSWKQTDVTRASRGGEGRGALQATPYSDPLTLPLLIHWTYLSRMFLVKRSFPSGPAHTQGGSYYVILRRLSEWCESCSPISGSEFCKRWVAKTIGSPIALRALIPTARALWHTAAPGGQLGHQWAPPGTSGHHRAPVGTTGHHRAPAGTSGHHWAPLRGARRPGEAY